MTLEWIYSSENVDWEELSALYRVAPLGQKDPADLKMRLPIACSSVLSMTPEHWSLPGEHLQMEGIVPIFVT